MLVILTAALGFFCGGMLLLLISMVTNESIGGGDIKLVALLGICHGASGILEILVASSLLALMHLGGRSFFRKKKPERIAFVPYLTAVVMTADRNRMVTDPAARISNSFIHSPFRSIYATGR